MKKIIEKYYDEINRIEILNVDPIEAINGGIELTNIMGGMSAPNQKSWELKGGIKNPIKCKARFYSWDEGKTYEGDIYLSVQFHQGTGSIEEVK